MISGTLLERALVALGVMYTLSLLFLIAHGVWLAFARRYVEKHLARGRAALTGLITADIVTEEDVAVIRSLPTGIQTRLFVELSRSFGGAVREKLCEIGTQVGTVQYAERMLRSRRWWRRLRGVRILGSLGAAERLIREHLRDPYPAVRAQVAEWAAEYPEPDTLRALLEILSGADQLYRFTVQDALLRAGQAAVEPLAEYLSSHQGPDVLPALEVAGTFVHPTLSAPALSLSRDAHPVVRARAADVLGGVGGEEAIARLLELLGDPAASVRAAAAHALARLRHWPAASAIAPLLRDPAWEVRRAAGLGLRTLGSPGLLFLRLYRTDSDRFAADMAIQVLDLPTAAEEVLS